MLLQREARLLNLLDARREAHQTTASDAADCELRVWNRFPGSWEVEEDSVTRVLDEESVFADVLLDDGSTRCQTVILQIAVLANSSTW